MNLLVDPFININLSEFLIPSRKCDGGPGIGAIMSHIRLNCISFRIKKADKITQITVTSVVLIGFTLNWWCIEFEYFANSSRKV